MFWPQYNVRIVLTITRPFWQYPICWGPLDQSGLGSSRPTTRARAMLQLVIREFQYVLQHIVIDKIILLKQLILVFFAFFSISVALAQNTMGITTATTMAAAGRNAPYYPTWGLALRADASNGWATTLQACGCKFWGDWGCVWPSKRSFVPGIMRCHKIRVFWGPCTPSTAPKIISACSRGCWPSIHCIGSEHKATCGSLGGPVHRRRPWSAMVVLVDVGHWRLTSDRSTVGIVTIVYGSIFFNFYVDPIHSWHLSWQLKKDDLDLRTLDFSWFLCPVFYGSFVTACPRFPFMCAAILQFCASAVHFLVPKIHIFSTCRYDVLCPRSVLVCVSEMLCEPPSYHTLP